MRTRSTGLISPSTVRIGLIFSAPPTHACAPPTRPPRRRYSSVSRQNQICACFARARGVLGDLRGPGARARLRRRGDRGEAEARRAAARVEHRDAFAQAALGELLARLQRGVVRARHRAREVDRDDVAAGVEQRLVGGEEVADRRLRRRRHVGRGPQALVERVEVRDLALALERLAALDVQRDDVDVVPRQHVGGQVVRAVGDHGDRHRPRSLVARGPAPVPPASGRAKRGPSAGVHRHGCPAPVALAGRHARASSGSGDPARGRNVARPTPPRGERRAMLARVTTWEGGSAEGLHAASRTMRENVSQGPPPGVKSTGITMLVDAAGGRALIIAMFESEADLRESAAALQAMNPPEGIGTRTATDVYEVVTDVRMQDDPPLG